MASITSAVGAKHETTSRAVCEYLREKSQQRHAVHERTRPLTLLELPVDILQLIVKEITHTNDLTALALTHSALYNLAIPLIYSRFDIVWPDGQLEATESKSVDALTYGLSTLCLGSAFASTVHPSFGSIEPQPSKLGDNDYARHIKKFSLGNGPKEWVSEYLISKESGKMLGTLVASAILKMKNLEAFVWDMPTGVLARVFEALAALGRQPDNACKLERVWVRWHDNSESAEDSGPPNNHPNNTFFPAGSQLTAIGFKLPANATYPPPRTAVRYSEYHCEYPTFSVLPPLKSLNVLEIDEIGYLDEMATLIERSRDSLQELRVSIAARAAMQPWAHSWDGSHLRQVDPLARWPGESTIGDRRLGGVLGVLVSKIYDIRRQIADDALVTGASTAPAAQKPAPAQALKAGAESQKPSKPGLTPQSDKYGTAHGPLKVSKSGKPNGAGKDKRDCKLKLQTLELEGVELSLHVCRFALDWSVLTHLTLINCRQADRLWGMLRAQFPPTPIDPVFGISSRAKPAPANPPLKYHLALKAIHVSATVPSLISFIKETLAPNSLEVLFLQDHRRDPNPIPLDVVMGAVKHHCASLRKLLLDSGAIPPQPGAPPPNSSRWREWALSTKAMLYITSGRMRNLRELAVSLEYNDWHAFLQRLPNIPQLRSLNIPHLGGYPVSALATAPAASDVVGGGFDPRELALQIVDIVALRPEIKVGYVGVGAKCFEILEAREVVGKRGRVGRGGGGGGGSSNGPAAATTTTATPVGAAVASGVTTAVVPPPVSISSLALALPLGQGGYVGGGGGGGGAADDVAAADALDPDSDWEGEAEGEGDGDEDGDEDAPASAAAVADADAGADAVVVGEDDAGDEAADGEAADGEAGAEGEDDDGGQAEVAAGVTHDVGAPAAVGTDSGEETQTEDDAASAGNDEEGEEEDSDDEDADDDDDDEDDADADDDDDEDEDDDDGFIEPGSGGVKLKLREILFYDDKVAIFRARHGRL